MELILNKDNYNKDLLIIESNLNKGQNGMNTKNEGLKWILGKK